MKVYFDNCSLQRPLDEKKQVRVMVEAEAVLSLLALCESGKLELVSSEVLLFETLKNPDVARGHEFTLQKINVLDALHLASAEAIQADCFCTTDDKLLKEARKLKKLKIKVVSPIHLIEEVSS
ncbi:nucleic acid-binding protein [candidate division KSB1 bacterium]|nr:nucleic acid-binding protein [candidate division KSB1 bacterium]